MVVWPAENASRAYLLGFEERDPYVIQELLAILPGEVTQVGDKRRGNEDVTAQSFLLLLILHSGLRPALLLRLKAQETEADFSWQIQNDTLFVTEM